MNGTIKIHNMYQYSFLALFKIYNSTHTAVMNDFKVLKLCYPPSTKSIYIILIFSQFSFAIARFLNFPI